jgi:branched-chain amino acid transport system ATP-binding protein
MLNVSMLEAGYGAAQVLFGLSFAIAPGETLALMGRYGMGKTTTVRAVMGLLRPTGGTIRFAGTDLTGTRPHRAAQAGIGLVPEGRQVFPTLSVEENLLVTATDRGADRGADRGGAASWTLSPVYALFPRLAERRRQRGALLSGGEQQMLAIGRALMINPRLLILDEATEGLAPLVRAEIYTCLAALKLDGQSILLIDKHLAAVSRLADRVAVLEKGRIAWEGPAASLVADPALVARHLHV